ncbi:hypothetical protein NKH18_46340 [Streptomyces sp. M10(2022)]
MRVRSAAGPPFFSGPRTSSSPLAEPAFAELLALGPVQRHPAG